MRNAAINPSTYYDKAAVRELLGVSGQKLNRACLSGELQFSDRAGKRLFRGEWLIAWLDGFSRKPLTEDQPK